MRVSAVRGLDDDAGSLLIEIAREDSAPEVRLAAVEQMPNLRTLVAFLRDPGDDAAARAEAMEGVRATLIEAADDIDMTDAFEVLTDERDLAAVARSAKSEVVARAALERVTDEATLGSIARRATRTDMAVAAVARIASGEELLAVATKAELKGPAVAACERLAAGTVDAATLDLIARNARSKASVRWARVELEERAEPDEPESAPAPEPDPTVGVAACERLESLAVSMTDLGQGRRDLDDILETWSNLDGPMAAEVGERFAQARTAVEDRLLALDHMAVEARRAAEQQAAEAAAEAAAEKARRQAAAAEEAERRRTAADVKAARKQEARDNLTQLEGLLDRVATVMAAEKTVSLGEAERLLRWARQALKEMPPLPSRHDREAITRKLRDRVSKLTITVRELREFADWQQWANLGVQESLCREMEVLGSEDGAQKDDAALASAFTDIMKRWRLAADVPKERGQPLWERFKAAHDRVYPRCEAYFTAQKEAQAKNLKRRRVWAENYAKKMALCERIEGLADAEDLTAAIDEAKRAQTEWRAIGPIRRSKSEAVWKRFRAACDVLFDRLKEGKRPAPPAIDPSQQLTRLKELCEQAEKLLPAGMATSNDTAVASPAELLARKWRERMAANTMGQRADDIARQRAAHDEVKRLVAARRRLGSVGGGDAVALDRRFQRACDQVFRDATR